MTFTTARPILARLIVLALGTVVALVAAGFAAQQADAQAICDQYPDLPECQEGPGGGGGGDGDDDGDGDRDDDGDGIGPSGGAAGGDADGALPFTGYPLTPLILLLLLLLALGIAIRTYLAARERRQVAFADGIQQFRH